MLSGTSTQSPVSTVFSLPPVSMPLSSFMATAATMATSLTSALPDSFFPGAVSPMATPFATPVATPLAVPMMAHESAVAADLSKSESWAELVCGWRGRSLCVAGGGGAC